MKEVVSKLNHSIRLLTLLAVFGLLVPNVASAFSSAPNLFAYDEQNQTTIVYDGPSLVSFDYDSASVPPANENDNLTVRRGGIFAKFVKLVAAEGGLYSKLRGEPMDPALVSR